jgi:O-antigen ligase
MCQFCNGVKKIVKLENLILFSIVALPLYLVKLDFFGVPANVLDILQLATVSWWIWEIKSRSKYLWKVFLEGRSLFMPAGLIFLGLIASILVNGNYLDGAGVLKSWFVLPFLFSLAATDVFRGRIAHLFKALYLSTAVTSFIALAYYVFGQVTYDGRLEAFFNSPNYLGMYLAPGIIIGTFFFKENKKIFGISLAAIIIAFYLTQSYAAWIAVAGALCLSAFFLSKERKKILCGALAIVLIFVFYQLGTKKWDNVVSLKERSSFSSRIMIWKAAEHIIKDNFVWGIGPENFQEKYLEYQKFYPPYLEWAVPHPHSVYLAFWVETGLVGLIGFLWLVISWFKKILQAENDGMKVVLFGIMAYFLLHGLVDTTYFKNDLAAVFWLVIFSLR